MADKITYNATLTGSRFHHSPAAVRGLMGPIGSGKSVAMCFEILRLAQVQKPDDDSIRRTRFAVVRNTQKELKLTTIKTWMDWMAPLGTMRWSDSIFTMEFNDVYCEVIFMGLDRPDQLKSLLSLELTGAFLNEARELQFETVQMIRSRLGRYPSRKTGPGATRPCLIMDTNPPSEDSWWYKMFEEIKPDGWELFRQPGGLEPNAENVENLPKGYYTDQMSGNTDAWLKVYRDGQYAFLIEGKAVYPEYNETLHLIEDYEPNINLPILLGMDFGRTPVCVMAQRDAHGRYIMIDELQCWDMGATEFGELLYKKIMTEYPGFQIHPGWGDPAGDDRSQVDDRTPMMMINKAGIKMIPAPSQDPFVRIEALRAPLTKMYEGLPAFRITPKCIMLRKALGGGYNYKRKQVAGTARYDVKPDKNEYSHVADATQYLMVGAGEGVNLVRKPNSDFDRMATAVATKFDPQGKTDEWSPFN